MSKYVSQWQRSFHLKTESPLAERLSPAHDISVALQWPHNERHGMSNHRQLDGLFNSSFRSTSKKIPKPASPSPCLGNPQLLSLFRTVDYGWTWTIFAETDHGWEWAILHALWYFYALFLVYEYLNTLNCFKITRDIFTFWIVSWIWLGPSRWNQPWNNNRCCLCYTANTMPADALGTLGARASTGMVLTPKAGIFRRQHQKSSIGRWGILGIWNLCAKINDIFCELRWCMWLKSV